MAKVIDFDDAVKVLRKGAKEVGETVSKGVSKGTQESIEAAAKKSASSLKATAEAANKAKIAQQRIEDAARRSATKIQGNNRSKIIRQRASEIESSKLLDSLNTPENLTRRTIRENNILAKKEKIAATVLPNKEAGEAAKQYRELRMLRSQERKIGLINENTSMFSNMSDADMRKYTADAIISNKIKDSASRKVVNTNMQKQFDKNSMIYRATSAGVGGALVFSMANNKGQQSNDQLYGQR